jgi:predicted small integral membrane protein
MGRLIKVLVVLVVLGFAGLVAYAYLADLSPVAQEVRLPVTLHAD